MLRPCKILIVDDHPLIVEAYSNVLLNLFSSAKTYQLEIDSCNDCHSSYEKLFNTPNKKQFDLVFLDIGLPPSEHYNIFSGEDLGAELRKRWPLTKIIVLTQYSDPFRINNILHKIDPEGFLIKSEIEGTNIIQAFKAVQAGETFYSETVKKFVRKRNSNVLRLDDIDIKILYEISNGSKMKELLEFIPLSKSAIEKRRRIIKEHFEDRNMSDRAMILKAKEKGFI